MQLTLIADNFLISRHRCLEHNIKVSVHQQHQSHADNNTNNIMFVASVVYMTSWTNVTQIQQEIMTYGPVTALMYVYENFMGYKEGRCRLYYIVIILNNINMNSVKVWYRII